MGKKAEAIAAQASPLENVPIRHFTARECIYIAPEGGTDYP